MAGPSLSRLPKESVTDSGEVIEPDSSRIVAEPADDFFNTVHLTMISLLILVEVLVRDRPNTNSP